MTWGGGGKHLLVFPVRGGQLLDYWDSFPPMTRCANPGQHQAIRRCWQLDSPTQSTGSALAHPRRQHIHVGTL